MHASHTHNIDWNLLQVRTIQAPPPFSSRPVIFTPPNILLIHELSHLPSSSNSGIPEGPLKLSGAKLAHPISLYVAGESALNAEVGKHDLGISLIPYTFHAAVIKSAIKEKEHVVTTNYVSPAMMLLDQQCKDAGITVTNEIGLDPGIDHHYAVKTTVRGTFRHAGFPEFVKVLIHMGFLSDEEQSFLEEKIA
ncbi:hypothetical protein BP5796_01328 [Coleophoma crateriformis]|uniref:Saccharopine dehydrogenase NADP binding domain-containing protein n=1 Tax=Coleophoma crateriformis TaxID=565419 RepID=A0A3D8T063_9HELO|nr:hypothetical protein BP5796_01328 [Coleophoma crateriformis]